ncbi:MAG: hypothetical protein HQL30_08805 [Candidatus Omnitrophica bacterium]|nr:hypothetical protein [Candidatus Omnitrophota bacterium]
MRKILTYIVVLTFTTVNLSFGDARGDLLQKMVDHLSPMLRSWGISLEENQGEMDKFIGGLGDTGEEFLERKDELKADFAKKYLIVSFKRTWALLLAEAEKELAGRTGKIESPFKRAAGHWNDSREETVKKWIMRDVLLKAEGSFRKAKPRGDFSPVGRMIEEVIEALFIEIDAETITDTSQVTRMLEDTAGQLYLDAGTPAEKVDSLIREAIKEGWRDEIVTNSVEYSITLPEVTVVPGTYTVQKVGEKYDVKASLNKALPYDDMGALDLLEIGARSVIAVNEIIKNITGLSDDELGTRAAEVYGELAREGVYRYETLERYPVEKAGEKNGIDLSGLFDQLVDTNSELYSFLSIRFSAIRPGEEGALAVSVTRTMLNAWIYWAGQGKNETFELPSRIVAVKRGLIVNLYNEKMADALNSRGLAVNSHPGRGGDPFDRLLYQVHQDSGIYHTAIEERYEPWTKHEIAHIDRANVDGAARVVFHDRYDAIIAFGGKELTPSDRDTLKKKVSLDLNTRRNHLLQVFKDRVASDVTFYRENYGIDLESISAEEIERMIPYFDSHMVEAMVETWFQWVLSAEKTRRGEEVFVNEQLNLSGKKGEADVSAIQKRVEQEIDKRYPESQNSIRGRIASEVDLYDRLPAATPGDFASTDTGGVKQEVFSVTFPGGQKRAAAPAAFTGKKKDSDVYPYIKEVRFMKDGDGDISAEWSVSILAEKFSEAPAFSELLSHIEFDGPVQLVSDEGFLIFDEKGNRTGVLAKGSLEVTIKDGKVAGIGITVPSGAPVQEYKLVAQSGQVADIRIKYEQKKEEKMIYAVLSSFFANIAELRGKKTDIFLPVEGFNKNSDIAEGDEREDNLNINMPGIVKRLQDIFNDILGKADDGENSIKIIPYETSSFTSGGLDFKRMLRAGANGVVGLALDKVDEGVSDKLKDFHVLPFRNINELAEGKNRDLIEMTALAIMQARLTGDKILDKSNEYVSDFARAAGLMYEKDLLNDRERHNLFLFIPHSGLPGHDELYKVRDPWVQDFLAEIDGWKTNIARKINFMLGEMKPLIQELKNRFDAIKKTMWSA